MALIPVQTATDTDNTGSPIAASIDFGPRKGRSYLMDELGPIPAPPGPTDLREFVCMLPAYDLTWPKNYYIY